MPNKNGNSGNGDTGDGGTVSPAVFAVGSLESRAAARAMLEARKTGKAEPAMNEQSYPGKVTFEFALSMAGTDGLLRYRGFIESLTADDAERLEADRLAWVPKDEWPGPLPCDGAFPFKFHNGQFLECVIENDGSPYELWQGDHSVKAFGIRNTESIVLRDAAGSWRVADYYGSRMAQRLWHDIETYAGGWAGQFPESGYQPRFLTIKIEMAGHRLIPVKRNVAAKKALPAG